MEESLLADDARKEAEGADVIPLVPVGLVGGVQRDEKGEEAELRASVWGKNPVTRPVARKLRRSFPAARDRAVAVVFVVLAVALVSVQFAFVARKMSRSRSHPDVAVVTVAERRLAPQVGVCLTLRSEDSALFAVLVGDEAPSGPPPFNNSNPDAQYPYAQVSFDHYLNNVSMSSSSWSASSTYAAVFDAQMESEAPTVNRTALREAWGWTDVTADRITFDFPEVGLNKVRHQRCAVFNTEPLFAFDNYGQHTWYLTVISVERRQPAEAGSLFPRQYPLYVFTAPGDDLVREPRQVLRHRLFLMQRRDLSTAITTLSRRVLVNGTVRSSFAIEGSYVQPLHTNNLTHAYGLLGINSTVYDLALAQTSIEPSSYVIQETVESPSYSYQQLVADIGGTLGALAAVFAFLFPAAFTIPHQLRFGGACASCGKPD